MYVTSHIHAQLGNMLFQIAAAVSYGLDHGHEVRFPELAEKTAEFPSYRIVFRQVDEAPFPKRVKFDRYYENETGYEEIPLKKNLILDGYFQSDRYFAHHKQEIVDLFSPSEAMVQEIRDKYGSLLEGPTVAVHIRTFIPDGNDPLDPNNWGGFDWAYFIRAMEFFPREYQFLIFSDVPEWTKSHFPTIDRSCVFIEGNPTHFDFYFMSLCDHQVVSPRSSYSWWAAYLNRNVDKIVLVADRRGVCHPQGVPEGWCRIGGKD